MGSIEENLQSWSHYDWSLNGDDWSVEWGGTHFLWWGTVFSRIHPFFPVERVLELAPGYGRCTQYLKDMCNHLVGVDLAPNCVEACRQRFAGISTCEFHVNDGRSLSMVDDHSIDFLFSWDSMVHVEAEPLEAYLHEAARILKPGCFGFIHHSNTAALLDPESSLFIRNYENKHWRATTMSAQRFRDLCDQAGLSCVSQEIIGWGGTELNDTFSLFTTADSPHARPTRVIENPDFMEEAHMAQKRATLYDRASIRPET